MVIFDIVYGLKGRIDLNPFASCQLTSGTSLEYPHGILCWYLKIAIFYHIFDIFSGTSGLIDLIPFALSQATSGTSLEYPHGILWWNLKITIFGHPGPQGGDFLELKPMYSQNVLPKDDF